MATNQQIDYEMPYWGRDRMPTAPTLLTPANHIFDVSPEFTWSAVPLSTHYEFELATDAGFSSIVDTTEVNGTAYSTAISLTESLYYWRVRAVNNFRSSDWSAVWSFAPIYLLNDTFTTPVAAPLDASRSSEPGPGLMNKSLDSGNRGSIASGEFHIGGSSPVSFTDPRYFWSDNDGNGFSRKTGRIYCFKNFSNNGFTTRGVQLGVSTTGAGSSNLPFGVYFEAGADLRTRIGNASLGTGVWAVESSHVVIVDLNPGFAAYRKVSASWELLFETSIGTQTPLFSLVSGVSTSDADLGDMVIRDTSGLSAVRVLDESSPDSGAVYPAMADGIFELECTQPASPVNGDKIEYRYRIQDEQNYWTIYFERVGTGWRFKHDKVINGTPTNFRDNLKATIGYMGVHVKGNVHNSYVRLFGTYGREGDYITDSDLNTATDVAAVYVSSASPVTILALKLTDSNYDAILDML